MTSIIKKQLIFPLLILFLGLFYPTHTNAASLSSVSDRLTTSRPSAAAPLAADQAAGDTQLKVVDIPTSVYDSALWLASDSAVLLNDTGQNLETLNVASMSAANTPSANQRILSFTSATANKHHQGTAVITAITSTHTISFTTVSGIPIGGHIILQFPGAGGATMNIASPSATGFSFNGMTTSNPTDVKYNFPGSTTCTSVTVTNSNTIDCVTATAVVNPSSTITVLIGCSAQAAGICTTFAPRLINPVKVDQTICSGSPNTCYSDTWKIKIKTQDNNAVDLDSASALVGVIESVQVQGTVEPYLTFTIAGVANATGSFCGDTTNPGIGLDSTATFVNLGSLTNTVNNLSGQTIVINTNGSSGYSLTATSSGRFINTANGFFLPDANIGNGLTANSAANGTAPSPAVITAGVPAFGIHPCSAGSTSIPTIPTAGWGSGGGASNKYANPWNTAANGWYALLATFASPASNSTTQIEYGATVSPTTPPGIYTNVFTYVATATF